LNILVQRKGGQVKEVFYYAKACENNYKLASPRKEYPEGPAGGEKAA